MLLNCYLSTKLHVFIVVSLALNEVEGSSSDEDSSIEDEVSDDEEQR